jgi:acetolactate synthase-1/2/3 large subunit
MGLAFGRDILCATLQDLGVEHVFGVPGAQNLPLFESLRRSSLRTVVTTSELAASFAANGYFRSSGKVGVLTTISGPGFTYALSGIAEARLDSAAVLCVVVRATDRPGRFFQLQHIDQKTMVGPIAKRVDIVNDVDELRTTLAEAFFHCSSGEPGPVMVEVAAEALEERAILGPLPTRPEPHGPDATELEGILGRLLEATRPLLYVGQGTAGGASELQELAGLLQCPVLTTTSARGVLPEDDPLCIPVDFQERATPIVNDLVESSDLVVALGCKMSQNGAHGFRLRIPPEKLIHVDASDEILSANYPASFNLLADVPALLKLLLRERSRLQTRRSLWQPDQLEQARERSERAVASFRLEPVVSGVTPPTPRGFFQLLREHMPRQSLLCTDSGLHQILARRHFRVLAPRGLIVPSDFQSMGFGLAAAIGAKLACPDRMSVALVGDGGLMMSGTELLTAVAQGLALTAVVFSDGHLGLIRAQQMSRYGHTYGTRLQPPDWELFARSLGVAFVRVDDRTLETIPALLESPGVHLLEVPLHDRPGALISWRASRAARVLRHHS